MSKSHYNWLLIDDHGDEKVNAIFISALNKKCTNSNGGTFLHS
jgi:hypothetical protein